MSNNTSNTNKVTSSFLIKEDGLSLIEVCIALIVIGILMAPLMAQLQEKKRADMLQGTNGSIFTASDALTNFFTAGNNSYPCPASLTAAIDDNDFGLEVEECSLDADISDITPCTDPTWVNLGICKTGNNPATAVIIGAVPFASLKLSQGQELDAWGNKLIYAVGFNQTKSATFEDGNSITPLIPDNPRDLTEDGIPDQPMNESNTPATPIFYQYIIFSTGSNGLGGFNKDGVRISDCSNPADEMSELENCDFDDIFIMREDDNIVGASMASDGALYYDDYTLGLEFIKRTIWHENSTETNVAMTRATRVGIGTQDPIGALHVSDENQNDANMLIAGQVDANGVPILDADNNPVGGRLRSDNICSEQGGNRPCFNPKIVGGDVPEMKCNSTSVVGKLAHSSVKCSAADDESGQTYGGGIPISTNGAFSGECKENVSGGGTVDRPATGFNSSGVIKCN